MKLMRARYDIIDILRNRYLRFSVNNAHARTQTVRRFVSYVQHINWKCGIVWWAEVKKRERERQAYRGNQEETVRHRARETNILNELSSSIIIPSAAASTADVRGWISTGFRHATALGTLSECVCVFWWVQILTFHLRCVVCLFEKQHLRLVCFIIIINIIFIVVCVCCYFGARGSGNSLICFVSPIKLMK